MRKGSVTIFSLLSMMLVVSALFALLEAGRFQGMKRLTKLQTQTALESVFAEYNTVLWEEYRLLACKQSNVNSGIEESVADRLLEDSFATNFYQFRVTEIEQQGYTRLTDGEGSAYIQAAAGYMEKNLSYETAKQIYNQYQGIKDIKENSGFAFSDIEKALRRIKEEETSKGNTGALQNQDVIEQDLNTYRKKENPLELIQDLQKKGVLSLVVKDTSILSEKEMDISNVVSKRELPEAYHAVLGEVDWYTKVLFQQYLLTYLSNYTDEKEHALNYELEYLLGGKATDIENMKVVVNQLLALREAANFLYLSSSPQKVEEARVLAVAIAGASMNPAVIYAVRTAVLAAWAFAESILDLRTLLTGGKIALLKSNNTWTLDVDYISSIGKGYAKAKNCSNGLNYKDYVGILLLFQEEEQIAKRAMDVQEQTLRKRYEDEEIYLEDWILDVNVQVTYEYKPVFFSIDRVLPSWKYKIIVQEQFGYK